MSTALLARIDALRERLDKQCNPKAGTIECGKTCRKPENCGKGSRSAKSAKSSASKTTQTTQVSNIEKAFNKADQQVKKLRDAGTSRNDPKYKQAVVERNRLAAQKSEFEGQQYIAEQERQRQERKAKGEDVYKPGFTSAEEEAALKRSNEFDKMRRQYEAQQVAETLKKNKKGSKRKRSDSVRYYSDRIYI